MPESLKDLEAELKICRQRQDHLESLDIYEEIDRNGWSLPRHLVGMGDCYLKLRRRSDAKKSWFRALQIQPDSKEITARLQSTFTSWEEDFETHRAKPPRAAKKGTRQTQASSPGSGAGATASPDSAVGGQDGPGEISLDDILDSVPDRGSADEAAAKVSPASQTSPASSGAPASPSAGSGQPVDAPPRSPAASVRRPIPMAARMIDLTMDRYINWPFVFEDVAAARASKLDRAAHTPLPE